MGTNKKEILEIKNGLNHNYELIEVIPDCGGGIRDIENTIAVATDISKLITYSKDNFNYTPYLERNRRNDDGRKSHCDTWYYLYLTKILIL